MDNNLIQRKSSIFYGWWVLLACGLIQLYFSATFLTGFSALINPLINEFGWSYTLVSLAFTFRGFEAGVFAPIVGFLVDRYRPRKLLFIGSVLGALGLFLISRIHSLPGFFISVVILGIGVSMNSSAVVMTAAAHWFKKRPGLAMGILSMGAGAGGLLMPLVILLIDGVGWRNALVIFAIMGFLIITPLSILVKEPPKEIRASSSKGTLETKSPSDGLPVREVLKQKSFWLLASAVLFTGVSYSAILTHQIPYFVSIGFTRDIAGYLAMIIAIFNMAGRLGFGWLGDLISKRNSFLIAAFILLSGLAIFAYANSMAMAISAAVLIGAGTGAVITLRSVTQLAMFGRKAFATVQGLLLSGITFTSMVAPLFAGWIFDTYETYRPAWLIITALTFAAIPLILGFPRHKVINTTRPTGEVI